MPTCASCGNQFPWRVNIDGKVHWLTTRKNCLDCSPFGSHNTRSTRQKIDIPPGVCKTCNKVYVYDKKKGNQRNKCGSCLVMERHRKTKIKAVEYKGGKCSLCGYNRCMRALDFHHLDPDGKEFHIGGAYNRAWKNLEKELDKCVLVCRNCHAEIHDGMIDLGM